MTFEMRQFWEIAVPAQNRPPQHLDAVQQEAHLQQN